MADALVVVEAGHVLLIEQPASYFDFPTNEDELGLELDLGRVVAHVGGRAFRAATIRPGTFGSGAGVAARWVNLSHLKVLDVRPQVLADAVERYGLLGNWPDEPLRLHG